MTGERLQDKCDGNRGISRLRRRRVEIIAVIVMVVVVVALLGVQRWQGRNNIPYSPLSGDEGLAVTIPVRAGDKGVAWGNLELYNHSSSVIVLDRVLVNRGHGNLATVRGPYIWGKERIAYAKKRSLVAWQLPLPKEWSTLPEHPIKGYEIPPMPAGSVDGDENGIGPEIVVEFGSPTAAASISSIRVDYHSGKKSYSRTFDNSLTICPPADMAPCSTTSSNGAND